MDSGFRVRGSGFLAPFRVLGSGFWVLGSSAEPRTLAEHPEPSTLNPEPYNEPPEPSSRNP